MKAKSLVIIFGLVIATIGSTQIVFAEDQIDRTEETFESHMAEQKRLAEEIRDKFILKAHNPYESPSQIHHTQLEVKNSTSKYVEIENFKINNLKLQQAESAEQILRQILGYKEIHTKIDIVNKTSNESTETEEKIKENYVQKNILEIEKMRDSTYFKSVTSTPNPYIEDTKTIQEYDRIREQNNPIERIDQKIVISNIKSEQTDIAQKTLSSILGFKEIANDEFYSEKNQKDETLESEEKNAIERSDLEFEEFKIEQNQLAEKIRNRLFTNIESENPYLEFEKEVQVEDIEIAIETTIEENPEIAKRGDPIFELRKLLESDRAQELLDQITGEIYDETFEDDYIEDD